MWVGWGRKRHWVHELVPPSKVTACGYEVGEGYKEYPEPANWQKRRGNWYKDHPGKYCGLCMRMREAGVI